MVSVNSDGTSFLFLGSVPTIVVLLANRSSANGMLVKKLSIVTFLPFPHQGLTNRFTSSPTFIRSLWPGCLPT
ncbi:hypothetical protein T10_6257 [Trichinella papuae]|uniref:Uncharacterized protein n=1 Tax=Trichinella papuae TaxID=268474 RepID=A0A0V1MLT8_9BILA|nr:hypothetical protein T10_6257 [Trichinella papuae]